MNTPINTVPRYIIFLIDIFYSALALLFAYFVHDNFKIDNTLPFQIARSLFIIVCLNCVVFLSVKTYAGIVRYTSAQDSLRILGACAVSALAFAGVNSYLINKENAFFVPHSVIIIYALSSFLLLVTYRVLVKYCFIYIKNLKLENRKVIIYGAGESAIAAKRTLDHEPSLHMNILGFIDHTGKKQGKKIDNVKVFSDERLGPLLSRYGIDDVIISCPQLSGEKKNDIVNICLANNVKVRTLPDMSSLINVGQFANKLKEIKIEDLLGRKSIEINNEAIKHQLRDKNVLVTGAAGSIGSELVRQLIKFKPKLIILNDIAETPLHNLQQELEDAGLYSDFVVAIGDVRNLEKMDSIFKTYHPNYVYHAAAYKHVPMMEHNPSEAINTNVLGTKIVADLSVKYSVERFVMISTDKAVNPTNIMGASKRIAEIYVQSLFNSYYLDQILLSNSTARNGNNHNPQAPRFITTRFGNVLGSNGSVIPRFKTQIENGGPLTVTHPEITRYFMTIPEACRLVLEAGSMGNGGEIFVFDMGQPVKIVDLAKKMAQLSGLVVGKDINIVFSGLRPGEKLYEELLNDSENTMPTHHEKIMIAKVREYSFYPVNQQVIALLKLSQMFNDSEVVKKMKEIVPEFKSKNSVYEKFDQVGNEYDFTGKIL